MLLVEQLTIYIYSIRVRTKSGQEQWPLFFKNDIVRLGSAHAEFVPSAKRNTDVVRGLNDTPTGNDLSVSPKALRAEKPIPIIVDPVLLLVANLKCELHRYGCTEPANFAVRLPCAGAAATAGSASFVALTSIHRALDQLSGRAVSISFTQ